MGLIGEADVSGEARQGSRPGLQFAQRSQRTLLQTKALGTHAIRLAKATADRWWREAHVVRPILDAEVALRCERGSELIGPVSQKSVHRPDRFFEQRRGATHVTLSLAGNDICVCYDACDRVQPCDRRKIENERAGPREVILMRFVRAVNDDLPRLHANAASITGFDIAARQYQSRIALDVTMARHALARAVTGHPGSHGSVPCRRRHQLLRIHSGSGISWNA